MADLKLSEIRAADPTAVPLLTDLLYVARSGTQKGVLVSDLKTLVVVPSSPAGSMQWNNAGVFAGVGVTDGSHVAFGNTAVVNDTFREILNLTELYTGSMNVSADSQVAFNVFLTVRPSSVTDPFAGIWASAFTVQTHSADTHNYNTSFGNTTIVDHRGSGTIAIGIGTDTAAYAVVDGNITDAYGTRVWVANYGSGTITTARGIQIGNDSSGLVTNSIGLEILDHSGIGSTISRNIWSKGASSSNVFDGAVQAGSYRVGATPGIDFSGPVTSITVVKGIVTAAS